MSGDRGPSVSVPAALAAAREFGDVRFTLTGRQADLERELGRRAAANVACLFAAEVVEMTDHPREALRRKKDSSMRRAIDLVKADDAHACVSAGNTGALMATAHFVLKMLPGVERPAIVSLIPSRGGHTYMLDLGANASCTPAQLVAVRGHGLGAGGGSWRERTNGRGWACSTSARKRSRATISCRRRIICWRPRDINYVGFVEGARYFLRQGRCRGHGRFHRQYGA